MNSKQYTFTLKQYAFFATAFLALHAKAKGEAVYTDIDPDIMLDSDLETGAVDMDGNGTYDFWFINISYTNFYAEPGHYTLIQKIWAGGYGTFANEIAGTQDLYYYPYALSYGDLISNELSFQNWAYQRMAWRVLLSIESPGGGATETWIGTGGHWYPEVLDHYLGVHFIDEDDKYHFGWIRCDVKDAGRTLVVKDYAYEKIPDRPIKAGDKIGDTSLVLNPDILHTDVVENELLNAIVYSFNNTVYIHLPQEINNALVRVYDMNGKEVYGGVLIEQQSQIELNKSEGIYFVYIISGENRMSKKLFVN